MSKINSYSKAATHYKVARYKPYGSYHLQASKIYYNQAPLLGSISKSFFSSKVGLLFNLAIFNLYAGLKKKDNRLKPNRGGILKSQNIFASHKYNTYKSLQHKYTFESLAIIDSRSLSILNVFKRLDNTNKLKNAVRQGGIHFQVRNSLYDNKAVLLNNRKNIYRWISRNIVAFQKANYVGIHKSQELLQRKTLKIAELLHSGKYTVLRQNVRPKWPHNRFNYLINGEEKESVWERKFLPLKSRITNQELDDQLTLNQSFQDKYKPIIDFVYRNNRYKKIRIQELGSHLTSKSSKVANRIYTYVSNVKYLDKKIKKYLSSSWQESNLKISSYQGSSSGNSFQIRSLVREGSISNDLVAQVEWKRSHINEQYTAENYLASKSKILNRLRLLRNKTRINTKAKFSNKLNNLEERLVEIAVAKHDRMYELNGKFKPVRQGYIASEVSRLVVKLRNQLENRQARSIFSLKGRDRESAFSVYQVNDRYFKHSSLNSELQKIVAKLNFKVQQLLPSYFNRKSVFDGGGIEFSKNNVILPSYRNNDTQDQSRKKLESLRYNTLGKSVGNIGLSNHMLSHSAVFKTAEYISKYKNKTSSGLSNFDGDIPITVDQVNMPRILKLIGGEVRQAILNPIFHSKKAPSIATVGSGYKKAYTLGNKNESLLVNSDKNRTIRSKWQLGNRSKDIVQPTSQAMNRSRFKNIPQNSSFITSRVKNIIKRGVRNDVSKSLSDINGKLIFDTKESSTKLDSLIKLNRPSAKDQYLDLTTQLNELNNSKEKSRESMGVIGQRVSMLTDTIASMSSQVAQMTAAPQLAELTYFD